MFTVACILNEPLAATLRFAAWYLDQGAHRLKLYLDNPDDPALPILAAHPRIDATACTPEFWHSLHLDAQDRFTRRQNAAINHAYRQVEDGWLLNVDADELVWVDGRSVAEEVRRHGRRINVLYVTPAEAIQTPQNDGTHFRLPMRPSARRNVYGPGDNPLLRRPGLVGHSDGKALTRAGLEGVRLRQHWPDQDGNAIPGRHLGQRHGVYLLHFHDTGYDVWRAKLDWRLSSFGFHRKVRERLAQVMAQPDRESAIRAIYDKAYVFDADQLARLSEAGAHLALDLDFDAPIARHFPGVPLTSSGASSR